MIGGSMTRAFQLWLFNLVASRTRDDRKLGLVTEGPNCGLADLRVLIEEGKLVPVVDRSFHLSDVPDALRYFGNGRHKGKIAVNCVVE
jgi:NADPH:quinone reductase-like Zn-dependent oxidoreductase